MKEKDIRDIEDVVHEVLMPKNKVYLISGVIFVFAAFIGASLALLVTRL